MSSNNFDNEIFKIKTIEFCGDKKSICLQSQNGPCPLIAILNILLLRGEVTVDNDIITGADMVNIVGNQLLNCNNNEINKLLEKFSHLNTGLNVNVKFTNVKDFESSEELKIFEYLNINLYHCWLMDPNDYDAEQYGNLSACSHEQAILCNISDAWKENGLGSESERSLMVEFLDNNQSMMTFFGISKLHEQLVDGELCVLFHNNHFSVLYKRPIEFNHELESSRSSNNVCSNIVLFLLCTDIGYSDDVTWQTLNSTNGDTELVRSNFTLFSEDATPEPDDDEIVARKLAIDCDHEYALELQNEENAIQETDQPRPRNSFDRPVNNAPDNHTRPTHGTQVSSNSNTNRENNSCTIL